MAHRLPFLLETMRRQEPASSPSMKSVLHLEVPGHLARVGVGVRVRVSGGFLEGFRGFSEGFRRVSEGFRRARALFGEPAEEDVLRQLAQMHDVRRRLATDLAQRLAWEIQGDTGRCKEIWDRVRVGVRVRTA